MHLHGWTPCFICRSYLVKLAEWTEKNLMKLNEDKSTHMIYTRTTQDFASRLTRNDIKLDQDHQTQLLGVLITDDMKFEMNTRDICTRAFAWLSMITKLKYIGVNTDDFL